MYQKMFNQGANIYQTMCNWDYYMYVPEDV